MAEGTRSASVGSKRIENNIFDCAIVFEGGGYLSKDVYRPTQDCRMRTNSVPEFCPVCQRAIRRLIDFYTAP